MEKSFRRRLSCADHFITISEAVKGEMVRHLGLLPEKITVTSLGVDPELKAPPKSMLDIVLAKYGLQPSSYFLYVGTLEPRKNLNLLLRAYAGMSSSLRRRFPLVLTGLNGWGLEHFEKQVDRLGLRDFLIRTGYADKTDLPALYAGATAFIFPSLYEGFGLPVLEAMACGTPVIVSRTPALLELVGDPSCSVEVSDADALRGKMESLLEDGVQREAFRRKGLERAKRFTWKTCALKTLEAYQLSLASGK